MIEVLREGIEGRKFKATLFIYVGSLLALSPVAALIGFAWNYQKLLFITPVLVVILVGIEYALCGPAPELVVSKSSSKLPESTEGSTPGRGRLIVRLTRFAFPISASVFLASGLLRHLDEPFFLRVLLALLPLCLIMLIVSAIGGLVIGLARSRPKRDGLHIEHDKTKQ